MKDLERLRNIPNGQEPNKGLDEIDKMIVDELEEEEREHEPQSEPGNYDGGID